MDAVLTMEEITEKYHNEWLLITDPEVDDELEILRGTVVAHSASLDEIYRLLLKTKPEHFALEYVGEVPEDLAILI